MMGWVRMFSRWLQVSVRRSHLDRDLASMRGSMRGRVLEIGAGRHGRRGSFEPPVEKAVFWHFLDLSCHREPHVCGNAEALPFAPASYDAVLCLEVAEYIDDPAQALREMFRVLRPGGSLVFSMPFMHRQDCVYDCWRWSPAGVLRMLEASGFDVELLCVQAHGLGVAANIVKYAADIQPGRIRRLCVGLALAPLVCLLWRLDAVTARLFPQLADFTTGSLVLARRRGGEGA
ncbi:MAG TPA: class I SAM-dependent methyltransferase [Nitratidesulfovibrio sp.]|nr:class I SAM-dependent methyltransferase [Nitratidesulfovibrio sp.]